MNYNFFLLVLLFLVSSCDSSGRILPGRLPDATVEQKVSVSQIYEGDFRGANFVEVDLSSYQELIVILECGPKKTKVYPNGYSEGQDTDDPYYVVSKNALVFFNVKPDDRYWIKVSE